MPNEIYMQRALELGRLGIGQTSPNPMVGCVIVHENRIIGEGWHKKNGGPHAEVNAVNSVIDKGLLKHSEIYVTLEPCSHFGKTPPCADLLIESGVKKVHVSIEDPNPMVKGNGIHKMREAGIHVETGLLELKARRLNKRFLTSVEKNRPYITLKWAQTSDGFIARKNFDSKWISDEYSRQVVHKWRSEEDAILVGANTVRHDDPQLNVRDWSGRDPIRIIIDKNHELKDGYHVFDGSIQTYIYNTHKAETREKTQWIKISGITFLKEVLSDIHARNIQSVLIEGGSRILNLFINEGLWDEARVFTSPARFNEGIPAPDTSSMVQTFSKNIINDTLTFYKPE